MTSIELESGNRFKYDVTSAVRIVVSRQTYRPPETKHAFTGFFVPSHVIAAVFMYVVEAIGGFQGASETSEENEMWQEPPIKPDLSGRDSSLSSQQPRGEDTPKSPSVHMSLRCP